MIIIHDPAFLSYLLMTKPSTDTTNISCLLKDNNDGVRKMFIKSLG